MRRHLVALGAVLLAWPLVIGGCDDHCGNGTLQPDKGEQCDDGNTRPQDGCSTTCQVEGPIACSAGTAAEFLAAVNADVEARAVLRIASGLHYGTTTADVSGVQKCSEGGPTTGWMAVLKNGRKNATNGMFVYRTDGRAGSKANFVHFETTTLQVIEYQLFTMSVDRSVAPPKITMIARDGTTVYPAPPAALLAPALPPVQQEMTPPVAVPIEPQSWLWRLVAPREAVAAPMPSGYSAMCDAQTREWMNKMGKKIDNLAPDVAQYLDKALNCVSQPLLCSPTAIFQKATSIADFSLTNPAEGASCTTLDCSRGKCHTSKDGTDSWYPTLLSICVADSPTTSDCNTSCNEQCDTTTGECRGIKILSVTEEPHAVDSEVWRCGDFSDADEWGSGWQCPDGGDPAWTSANGYFNQAQNKHTYQPRMVFNWCGRPSKQSATFITPECGACSPGWQCFQGSSWIGGAPPNPFVLDPAWSCCSGGTYNAPLPSACQVNLKVYTGGVFSDPYPYTSTCEAQPQGAQLCDCSPPKDLTDPIDDPVTGYHDLVCPNGN